MYAVVEQQSILGDHAFQNADGVDGWGDGDPGDVALDAGGQVIASVVGGTLVLDATDQMSSDLPAGIGFGVRAASGPQAQDFSRSHARPVRGHDERGCAQMPHQCGGLGEVDRGAPGPSGDPPGDRDVQWARAWPLGGGGAQLLAVGEGLDLVD